VTGDRKQEKTCHLFPVTCHLNRGWELQIIVILLKWLANIVFWVTVGITLLFILRMILSWLNVNPFARIPYHLTRLTERVVQPIRYQIGGRFMRYDFVPLIAGAIVLITGLFIANTITDFAGIVSLLDDALNTNRLTIRFLLGVLILLAGLLYGVLIFLRILLPYFGIGYSNKFMRLAYRFTEPLLKPLRKFFTMGMVDFSAWIALILVQFATKIIAGIVGGPGF
jgi:uncharacterized protein YggT (Ycf19 family)